MDGNGKGGLEGIDLQAIKTKVADGGEQKLALTDVRAAVINIEKLIKLETMRWAGMQMMPSDAMSAFPPMPVDAKGRALDPEYLPKLLNIHTAFQAVGANVRGNKL